MTAGEARKTSYWPAVKTNHVKVSRPSNKEKKGVDEAVSDNKLVMILFINFRRGVR
jgi:hypothetical protein